MNDYLSIENLLGPATDSLGFSLPGVAFLLLLVISIGILSSRAMRARTMLVRHLFLKSTLLRGLEESHVAYVRAMDLTGAIIVTSFAPQKGSFYELELAPLATAPQSAQPPIRVQIKQVRGLGAQPSNYLVHLKYDKNSLADHRESLGNYLKQLQA